MAWLAAPALAEAPPKPGLALRWPLDPPISLRSAFGEYREGGRVHGGVDLSTGGRTGLPVRAAADGEVFRLKVEWRGYGRAAYQKLADGRVLVYAHLERFVLPGLEEAVVGARQRAGRFPGDLPISPPIPVLQGEILALSGESGAGLPHLHFEIRSAQNTPLNPLEQVIQPPLEDREPPLVDALWFFSATPESWAGSGPWRPLAGPDPAASGVPEAGPIEVAGTVDLAVEAHDPAPEEGRLGITSLTVFWDGREVASMRVKGFRFDEGRRVASVHDAELSHLSPTRFVYRLLGADGGPASDPPAPVRLQGAPGTRHALEVAVRDAVGNQGRLRSTIAFFEPEQGLRSAAEPRSPGRAGDAGAGWKVNPERAEWLDGAVRLPLWVDPGGGCDPCEGAHPYRLMSADAARRIPLRVWTGAQTSPGPPGGVALARLPADGRVRFEPLMDGRPLRAAQKRMGGSALKLECGDFAIELPAGAFPRGTPVSVQERESPSAGPGAIGEMILAEPAWRVPQHPARVRFRFDATRHRPERVGVYRYDSLRARWIYEGGVGEARQGALAVNVDELGSFRLIEDAQAPELGITRPAAGEVVEPEGWRVRVEAEDFGSGIGWDGIQIELDGRRLEAEYDPDRKWAEAALDAPLVSGEHRLQVRGQDRAGNQCRALAWVFTVRPRR
jgi:hypothetical protein